MKNRFKINELVKVSGFGKIYGNVKEKLGFIVERDEYFKDYYIDLIFGKSDWFEESSICKLFYKIDNKNKGREKSNDSK